MSDNNIKQEVKENKPSVPEGLWIKCDKCKHIAYKGELEENLWVCTNCGKHFRIGVRDRIKITVDENSFKEFNENLTTLNPLNFPNYEEKIKNLNDTTGLKEAVVTGFAEIDKQKFILCVMDSNFLMGSMGSVVGEKITRAFEVGLDEKLPVVIFTASGGARMQEGIFSLMQMAKTSAAIAKFNEKGLLYITVLTDPTTGGVTASFAMLGDIIISEPDALIGFAGPRVIEQTIRQKLPEGFQKAEFLLEHGFVDMIVERKDMKNVLSKLLRFYLTKGGK